MVARLTPPIIPWSSTVLVRAPAHAGLPDRSGAPAGTAKLPRRIFTPWFSLGDLPLLVSIEGYCNYQRLGSGE